MTAADRSWPLFSLSCGADVVQRDNDPPIDPEVGVRPPRSPSGLMAGRAGWRCGMIRADFELRSDDGRLVSYLLRDDLGGADVVPWVALIESGDDLWVLTSIAAAGTDDEVEVVALGRSWPASAPRHRTCGFQKLRVDLGSAGLFGSSGRSSAHKSKNTLSGAYSTSPKRATPATAARKHDQAPYCPKRRMSAWAHPLDHHGTTGERRQERSDGQGRPEVIGACGPQTGAISEVSRSG